MNFEYSEAINPYLEKAQFAQAIQLATTKLAPLPASSFHAVIGKSMLGQVDNLCLWIDQFYTSLPSNSLIQALYFELTEFDINTDMWGIDGFAYAQDGGLEDPEWLASVEEDFITTNAFVISGYEDLQQAFEEDGDNWEEAKDWGEQIIIAQYMQLIYVAHQQAQSRGFAWATMPVYCTEHGYDFIVRFTGS